MLFYIKIIFLSFYFIYFYYIFSSYLFLFIIQVLLSLALPVGGLNKVPYMTDKGINSSTININNKSNNQEIDKSIPKVS